MGLLLDQFSLFARYNRLMNQRIVNAARQLDASELKADRGAFFRSVLGTLNHVLVGDIIWLKRFSEHPPSRAALNRVTSLAQPASLDSLLFDDVDDLAREREQIDQVIIDWITGLEPRDLEYTLAYRNMAGESRTRPLASLISHLFLHQVHHRGQATTLLSQYGIDFGDTDLLEINRSARR